MNTLLRVLLVDDERLARKRLRALLDDHPDIVVAAEAATVDEAAALAHRELPHLVFLDVQMPPELGFDLLPRLPAPAPAIVFVTAHDAFAVRAFEVSAVDYLLKPISPERLATALDRVRSGRHSASPFAGAPFTANETLILNSGDRIRRATLGEIAAVSADGHYTRVYLANEPPMFLQRGITSWAAQLPAPGFLRVDRSLVVNLARVRALDVESRDTALLRLDAVGAPLTLGRAATARLRAALAQ